jgi:hypothetical protein
MPQAKGPTIIRNSFAKVRKFGIQDTKLFGTGKARINSGSSGTQNRCTVL